MLNFVLFYHYEAVIASRSQHEAGNLFTFLQIHSIIAGEDVIYLKKWLYTVLLIFFSAVFLVSAFFLGKYLLESRKQQSAFNDLASLVDQVQQQTGSVARPILPNNNSKPDDPTEPTVTEPPMVEVTNPTTGETFLALPEYALLYEMNPHLVGWIKIDGTPINYPVMQTPTHTNYYLHRDFEGNYSAHGCIYVQESCNVFSPSDNLTIYGHKMKDGSMFAALQDYKKESFFKKHPTIVFDTITEHHSYEIVAVFLTTATKGQGFTYHTFVNAADEAEFDTFVSNCKALSLYDTGVDAEYGDKLITLSTCEYSQYNGRLVVVAKRIEN